MVVVYNNRQGRLQGFTVAWLDKNQNRLVSPGRASQGIQYGSGLEGGGWGSGGALGEEECGEEHGRRCVEGCAGDVDAGADGFAEDVSEEAGAEQAGDAAEAVDGSLKLALFGGAGLAGEKALGGGPGEGHHVE